MKLILYIFFLAFILNCSTSEEDAPEFSESQQFLGVVVNWDGEALPVVKPTGSVLNFYDPTENIVHIALARENYKNQDSAITHYLNTLREKNILTPGYYVIEDIFSNLNEIEFRTFRITVESSTPENGRVITYTWFSVDGVVYTIYNSTAPENLQLAADVVSNFPRGIRPQ